MKLGKEFLTLFQKVNAQLNQGKASRSSSVHKRVDFAKKSLELVAREKV